jgi:hypothetical protein
MKPRAIAPSWATSRAAFLSIPADDGIGQTFRLSNITETKPYNGGVKELLRKFPLKNFGAQ